MIDRQTLIEVLKQHRLWLKDVNTGRRANLSEADLSEADLSEANLREAYLSGTDLSGTDLSGADLSGTDLSEADLSGANLSEANLSGANPREAYLRGADLYGADLRGAYLSEADLRVAYLSGANLRGANLRGTCLVDGGQREDGYRFIGQVRDGVLWVIAGCRYFSIFDARVHWTRTRGGTPLGDESQAILDRILVSARVRGLLNAHSDTPARS